MHGAGGGSARFDDGAVEEGGGILVGGVVHDVVGNLGGRVLVGERLWRANGRGQGCFTECAPAERPIKVTWVGSPLKCAMLSWTHWRRRIWSCRPRLRMPSLAVSVEGRKPRAPILMFC